MIIPKENNRRKEMNLIKWFDTYGSKNSPDMIAIFLGSYIGIKVAKKASFNLSWLSGLILIFLAFSKL